MSEDRLQLYLGAALADYGFEQGHPFHTHRQAAFEREFDARGLRPRCEIRAPVLADEASLLRYHTPEHIEHVRTLSALGEGLIDQGDTPARKGIYKAACAVVGSTCDAALRIFSGEFKRAFVPIGGLHHARRDRAAGFCVFSDCGVAIERLFAQGLKRVAYVDIDVHHGDGVYYDFEDDPRVIYADLHQDGRTLYPGTGHAWEQGKGAAAGLKLNIPLSPGADDGAFLAQWPRVEALIEAHPPEMILMQCGADSLGGDPLASLNLTAAAHGHAAARLRLLVERHCAGRLLAVGGGGYDSENIAAAWTAVVESLL